MAVSRNTFIQHFIKKKILPLPVIKLIRPDSVRELHRNLLENKITKPLLKHNSTKNLESTSNEPAKKLKVAKHNEDDESYKKIEYKDWKPTDTSWLGKDQTESELVKHIEILQRFTEKYNAVVGNRSDGDKSNPDTRKKVKMMDKPTSQPYSTMVNRKPAVKTKRNVRIKTQPQDMRTYITLANEPEPCVPCKNPVVPNAVDCPNPDSIKLDPLFNYKPKPRLYSIVSNSDKTVKKTVPSQRKLKVDNKSIDQFKGKRPKHVNQFFMDRYSPRTVGEKLKTENTEKTELSTKDISQDLKQTLVETRKTTTDVEKAEMRMKTPPVLVKPTHMPLQRCCNMRRTSKGKSQSFDEASSSGHSKCEPSQKNTNSKSNVISKLFRYFKR